MRVLIASFFAACTLLLCSTTIGEAQYCRCECHYTRYGRECHRVCSYPREFLAIVESTKNRFVRWLGDGGRLARILGQKKGLNPRAVMDGRNIVLVDLSSLTYSDAAFIGISIIDRR